MHKLITQSFSKHICDKILERFLFESVLTFICNAISLYKATSVHQVMFSYFNIPKILLMKLKRVWPNSTLHVI